VITTYRYKNPWEYKITVTAVTNKGERASKTYVLIVKKPQETVEIQPSIASGLAHAQLPVTFEAKVRWSENVITWNFWDGTETENGQNVIHEFRTAGTYTVKVKVEYTSWIEESDTITYQVK
jgi:PKD repeat protein